MVDPTYPAFSILSFIGFILVLIPLPWHLQAWNSGTCLYMFWTALGSLNMFINSIIWHNNAIDWAPVWCDISTRIVVGVSVGIPSASLCINRRLYQIASCQTVNITHAHKRRAVMIDLLIGLGIPVLQMILQFVVQGHRYDIWEDVGCYPTTVNTPPAYPLSFLWGPVIGLISAVYCILTLREFMKRRAQFSQFVSSNTSLTVNRYFRLMCLATTELVFNLPITSYGLYLNITSRPIYPWKSWSDTHFDFFTIDTFPAFFWRSNPVEAVTLELSRWSLIFCAFLFFGFFGFADEARKHYRLAYWAVAKRFGVVPPPASDKFPKNYKPPSAPRSTNGSLPMYISRPLELSKRDSSISCSDATSFRKSDYTDSLHKSPIYDIKLNPNSPCTPTSDFPTTPATSDFPTTPASSHFTHVDDFDTAHDSTCTIHDLHTESSHKPQAH